MKSAATLKPSQASGYRGNTTQKPTGDKTRKPSAGVNAGSIPTVWDEQKDESEQHERLNKLAAGVERMSSVFEEEKHAREEQRKIMDLLHAHTMEQVQEVRKYMQQLHVEMQQKIQDFSTKFDHELDDMKEELIARLKEKIAAMTVRMQSLEERAEKWKVGLDEERAERIRQTEQVLNPIRKQIAKLIHFLGREQRIRRRRQEEMLKALDTAVENLNRTADVEEATREQKQKDMLDDDAWEFRRLENRQRQISLSTAEMIEEPQSSLDHEVTHRVDAQNNVVETVTSFMQRFRENIREESQM